MTDEVIRRDYLDILSCYRDVDLIKVITGMRRTGKSTIMRQYISVLENEGIPKECITYIDMDSMRNDRYKDGSLLYSDIVSRKDVGRQYILIDEVQNIDNWQRVIESLRNDIDCDIYITGSNAHMLSSEISTLLTGRSSPVTVLPLSLREKCFLDDERDYKTAFVRYLRHGGLPILKSDYSEEMTFRIIDELKSDIILKDICNRKPGVDPVKIRRVIDYLYSEIGNPISVNRIADSLGISKSTIVEYLQLITDSMLFSKVERYDIKGHQVLTQEPKYYCTDTGMRYSQPISSRRDFGKTLENIVYLELIRRGYRVYVGRTGTEDNDKDKHLEIDFIVPREDGTDYYQVTETLTDPTVRDRELRPLRMVTGRGERYVITYDNVPITKDRDAITINIVDFLMEGNNEGFLSLKDAPYITLLSMFDEYMKTCKKISETIVDHHNFDRMSTDLQSRFFDLQAFFRKPDLANDGFLEEMLPRIRSNNVRTFNAMVACVNANRESKYTPVMDEQINELNRMSEEIQRHINSLHNP